MIVKHILLAIFRINNDWALLFGFTKRSDFFAGRPIKYIKNS